MNSLLLIWVLVKRIFKEISDSCVEVDPEKMEEGTDLDEMRWMLMAQSQKILKFILGSAESCPVYGIFVEISLKFCLGNLELCLHILNMLLLEDSLKMSIQLLEVSFS
jgi:hypothetical protein